VIIIAALIILAAAAVGFLLIRDRSRALDRLMAKAPALQAGIDNPEIDEDHIGDFVAVDQQARDKGAV
jgi:hypothetical protein